LKTIGRVLHISPGKKALIKVERVPRIGETVVDDKKRVVGTVFDVVGPTVSPYVEVEVEVDYPQSIVNSFLYVSPRSKRKTWSRKGR